MPELPWYIIEEGIQRFREIGMLECICHAKHVYPPLEGPEDTAFTMTERNKFVRGTPTSLKSSGVTLLCRSEIKAGIAAT